MYGYFFESEIINLWKLDDSSFSLQFLQYLGLE
jgi:hypothetical protein